MAIIWHESIRDEKKEEAFPDMSIMRKEGTSLDAEPYAALTRA